MLIIYFQTRVFKGGWQPPTTPTPPPMAISPTPLSDSSVPSPWDIVTEGKRVTVNQAMDTTTPSLVSGTVKSDIFVVVLFSCFQRIGKRS